MKLNFFGKNLLIAGGSNDIAVCTAKIAVKENLFPTLTFRSQKSASRIEKELSGMEGKYGVAFLDFAEPDSVDRLFRDYGVEPDYLVDLVHGDYESLTASAGQDKINSYLNQNIAVRTGLVRLASRIMVKKRKGRLLYISSAAAERPAMGQGFYAASKLASEAVYNNTGLELASRGVTSLIIRPGYIYSGRGKKFADKDFDTIREKIPVKRLIDPQELAEAIIFFLSDSSLSFNAVKIRMDGGLLAGKQ
ncbi:SDR family oxidoreductase [Desulfobacterales bacterium HSG16]|nr:SDR family oxidoreductase [Desulfobacterales bacterium HSG16]